MRTLLSLNNNNNNNAETAETAVESPILGAKSNGGGGRDGVTDLSNVDFRHRPRARKGAANGMERAYTKSREDSTSLSPL